PSSPSLRSPTSATGRNRPFQEKIFKMATRIGVDIGGTFTDLVYFDERTGKTVEGKVPTVPSAPEHGVVDAITQHVPKDIIEEAEFFLHGTTVGLNALLERRGAKVGLITTTGFRDVL